LDSINFSSKNSGGSAKISIINPYTNTINSVTVNNSVNAYTSQGLKNTGEALVKMYGGKKPNDPLGMTVPYGWNLPVPDEPPITFSP
jgi:hypothetical protein